MTGKTYPGTTFSIGPWGFGTFGLFSPIDWDDDPIWRTHIFRGWLNHQLVLNNIVYLYNHMFIHIQSVWGFGWYKKWKKTWIKTLHWGWTVLWVTHASIEPSRCYPSLGWNFHQHNVVVPWCTMLLSLGVTLQFPATSGSLKHSTGTQRRSGAKLKLQKVSHVLFIFVWCSNTQNIMNQFWQC